MTFLVGRNRVTWLFFTPDNMENVSKQKGLFLYKVNEYLMSSVSLNVDIKQTRDILCILHEYVELIQVQNMVLCSV